MLPVAKDGYLGEYKFRTERSAVLFLLWVAVRKLWPEADLISRFAVNGGLYADLNLAGGMDADKLKTLREKMQELVCLDLPIGQRILRKKDAIKLFKSTRQIARANLLASLHIDEITVYECMGVYDFTTLEMPASTGLMRNFEINLLGNGILLRTEREAGQMPGLLAQPKLQNVLQEAKEWAGILHCEYVPDLNRLIRAGKTGELIRVSEALQEKKIAAIADRIAANIHKARIILIAGPSSSGKTSFTQRLKVQLRVNGLEPVCISLDDYYLSHDKTPRLPNGEFDFESINALDVELFNEHLLKLLEGQEVVLPHYDFVRGVVEFREQNRLKINEKQPLLIEGIHGLNDELTHAIPRAQKCKVYVSALMQLNIDAHIRIPTTEARLLRRMVRDAQFRAYDARKTLKKWPEVREGEEKNIFPYQEDADIFFNSALIYETAALQTRAVKMLKEIGEEEETYPVAQHLLAICGLFAKMKITDYANIPCNSILREFLGGSCFFDRKGDLKI